MRRVRSAYGVCQGEDIRRLVLSKATGPEGI